MAISYVAAGTRATAAGASTSPAIPSGVQANDLLVLVDVIVRQGSGAPATPTTPSGWTQKATYASSANVARITLMYRRWASGVTAPTVSYSSPVASDGHYSRIYAFRGTPATGDPTDVLGTGSSNSASTNLGPITGVTTTKAGGAVLVIGVREDETTSATASYAVLSGDSLTWAEIDDVDLATSGDGIDDYSVVTDYALIPTARTITAKTFTVTSGSSCTGAGIMWALAPEGVTPIGVNDSGLGDDPLLLDKTQFAAAADAGLGTEAISTYADIGPLADSALADDLVAVEQLAPLSASDSGIGTDTISVADFVGNDHADQGSGTDSITVDRLTFVTVTDAGVGSEAITLLQIRNLVDTGTGTDAVPIRRIADLPESGLGTDDVRVVVIPFTQVLPLRGGAIYDCVVVARIPQVSGPPAYLEVDPIEWKGLTYSNVLSQPQELSVSCLAAGITEPILQRLRRPHELATEIHLLRNGRPVFAGPLVGFQTSGEQMTLKAKGLLAYLRLMIVVSDMRFDGVDQHTIVKQLVDQWQSLDHGNYGVDTSSITPSGVVRDVEYKQTELHNVGQRIADLGAKANGFDIEVDPASRKLQLWTPTKGVDRSTGEDAVVIDARNVTSGDIICSIAIGDLASEAFGTSSGAGSDSTLYSTQSNTELRARYGRSAVTSTWTDLTLQADLDDAVNGLLQARDEALLVPGPSVRVTPDADLAQYGVGDTVAYELSSQLGVSGSFRLRKQEVTVSSTGQETVDLEFT